MALTLETLQTQVDLWALVRFMLLCLSVGFVWFSDSVTEQTMFWIAALCPSSLALIPLHATINHLPDFSVSLYVFFFILFIVAFFQEVGQIVTAVMLWQASDRTPKLHPRAWLQFQGILWIMWLLLTTIAVAAAAGSIPTWECPSINVHGLGASIGLSWFLGWSGLYALIRSPTVMRCSPSDVPKIGVVLAGMWVSMWSIAQFTALYRFLLTMCKTEPEPDIAAIANAKRAASKLAKRHRRSRTPAGTVDEVKPSEVVRSPSRRAQSKPVSKTPVTKPSSRKVKPPPVPARKPHRARRSSTSHPKSGRQGRASRV